MRVAGIDFSSHAVDLVTVPLEEGAPVWHHWQLAGADAFDRTRDIASQMPGRSSALWDELVAVGIEHPAGRYGVAAMTRLQGAILSCIPSEMLVQPLPPMRWRKLNGLPGSSSKDEVRARSFDLDGGLVGAWTQDAHDAHLIARATLVLLEREPV